MMRHEENDSIKSSVADGFGGFPILIMAACSGLIAILLGFIALPQKTMTDWFHRSGFYFIFFTVIIWVLSFRVEIADFKNLWANRRKHFFALCLALALTISAFLCSTPRFRILADETNLLGISWSMYEKHSFYNPTQVFYYFDGMCDVISYEWDKRPNLYPFLIYTAHVFFGYSGNNGFVINAIAGFLTFFIFYLLLQRWFSRFWGVVGMLLLAGYPLVILYMTSSGFEIVNLLFALITFLILDFFLLEPKATHLELLLLTLVLVAQVRYESVLFTISIFPVLFYCLPAGEYRNLTYRLVLTPILYLPVAWQRLTTYNAGVFQMDSADKVFSFGWLMPNLTHAYNFFMCSNPNYGTVPITFILSAIGFLAIVGWSLKRINTFSRHRLGHAFAAIVAVILHSAVMFLYYWGNLTLQYASRLGIIFLPFMIFCAVWLLYFFFAQISAARKYIVVLCLAIPVYYWPTAGMNCAVRDIYYYREFRFVKEFLDNKYPCRDVLLISDLSNLYTAHRYSALSFSQANANRSDTMAKLTRHLVQEILMIQRIKFADSKPTPSTTANTYLLEKLYEFQLNAEEFVRVSRVIVEPKPVLPQKAPNNGLLPMQLLK